MKNVRLTGKSKALIIGAVLAATAVGSAGFALASDAGDQTTPVLTPVDGAPDLSQVIPGTATPIGPVSPQGAEGFTTSK